jgi:hypothetical protein
LIQSVANSVEDRPVTIPYCQTSVRRILNLVVCCMQGCDARHRPLLQPVRRPAPSPVVPISQLPLSHSAPRPTGSMRLFPCPLPQHYRAGSVCVLSNLLLPAYSAACITVTNSPKCVDPPLLRQAHLLWALRDSKFFLLAIAREHLALSVCFQCMHASGESC